MGSRHAGTTVRSRRTDVEPPSSPSIPAASAGLPAVIPGRTRRRTAAGRRRPAALLAALVAGGLAAGLIGTQALPAADAADDIAVSELLGSDAEGMLEMEPLSPQEAITEVEARARLEEVAANRAERAEQAAQEQAAAEAAAEAARPKAVAPVDNARMTTCFCMRWGTMHWGIDLAAPMLTPEYAAEDGVVLRAGAASGYGQAVYILGVSGDVTVYGHMEKILVSPGDVVSAGDRIALLGSRGQSTGPHLHFEVHRGGMDGKRVDPVAWLRERGVEL
ncbi:M23 family metallopeptidase [Modestobacter versicolor]|uniref:M23 family peptidase n=1 Tax=Modestobacter versicolor TaxID=429133 RepID=A0A323V867_9ACTN|nr:M23 family metallopeptidase [Modestobacter versicolor]MBB3676241.1 murein DD-endopeptidase MepM/ murein hydrolase activator NlpD [Modestobacter versicolor]PZA20243.1 M23 family peptidase [Modestobacter versicolor]